VYMAFYTAKPDDMSEHIINRTVARVTGKWTHAEMLLPIKKASNGEQIFYGGSVAYDGQVYFHEKGYGKKKYKFFKIMLPAKRVTEMAKFMTAQKGKPFNKAGFYRAVIPGFRRSTDMSRWYCTELLTEAFKVGGVLEQGVKSSATSPTSLFGLLQSRLTAAGNPVSESRKTAIKAEFDDNRNYEVDIDSD
jgi:hypothetical protein